jgi:hypothetical protein
MEGNIMAYAIFCEAFKCCPCGCEEDKRRKFIQYFHHLAKKYQLEEEIIELFCQLTYHGSSYAPKKEQIDKVECILKNEGFQNIERKTVHTEIMFDL